MQNNETRPQTSADILMAGTQRMPGGHHGSQAARQRDSQSARHLTAPDGRLYHVRALTLYTTTTSV